MQPDTYRLDIGCRSGDSHGLDYIPSAVQIEVLAGPATPAFMAQRSSGVRLASKSVWKTTELPSFTTNQGKIMSRV